MPTLKVAIAGATGYAGEELIRILRQHPHVQLTHLAASAKWDRPVPVAEVFPRFAGQVDLPVEALDPSRLASACDLAFLALPHGVSMDLVPGLLKAGRRVIDLGGDFRLKDASSFERWYAQPHAHPELLPQAVYGLPELNQDAIRAATLVANPGCYATSVIIAAAPLLKAGLVQAAGIIVDAKSGLTGAGRKAEPALMFPEVHENLWAYKVNKHQHVPEIVQALAPFAAAARPGGSDSRAGGAPSIVFVPHIVPLSRGILSSVYFRLAKACAWEDVDQAYRAFYKGAPFVRIRPVNSWPKVQDVAGTNYCDLGFAVDAGQRLLIVSAAIDNLTKGAAGQAVQNMNLMAGVAETSGLL